VPKIDLSQQYTNADDSPAIDATTKEPMTLKKMLINALLTDTGSDGRPLPEADKIKRYSLYRDVKKAQGVIALPAEDVALLKKAAAIFPVLTMGQTHDMLEKPYAEPAQRPQPMINHDETNQ